MAIQATGQVVRDRRGLDLVIERRMPAPLPEVWDWFTTPKHLKKWLAPVTITEQDKFSRLRFDAVTVSFAEVDGSTMVFLDQRIDSAREAGEVGPEWEFRLDSLAALISGGAAPKRSDYFPSQVPYYERVAMDGDPVSWPPS